MLRSHKVNINAEMKNSLILWNEKKNVCYAYIVLTLIKYFIVLMSIKLYINPCITFYSINTYKMLNCINTYNFYCIILIKLCIQLNLINYIVLTLIKHCPIFSYKIPIKPEK